MGGGACTSQPLPQPSQPYLELKYSLRNESTSWEHHSYFLHTLLFFFTIFLLRPCIFKEEENKISHACADGLVCAHAHTDRQKKHTHTHTHTHTRQPKARACCSSEERWDPWAKRKLTDSHQPIIVKRKTPLRIKPLCQGLTDFAIGPRMLRSSYWSALWALPRPTWRQFHQTFFRYLLCASSWGHKDD